MRNVDGSFNKERSIKYIVEVNIYYQEHKGRTKIDIIREQKWRMILEMPQLAYHNPEIDWRTEEVKMTRCPEEYRRKELRRERTKEIRKKEKETKK